MGGMLADIQLHAREGEEATFTRSATVETNNGAVTLNVSGLILAGDIVLGVTRRNNTAIGGPASHQIGEAATPDLDAWGTVLPVVVDDVTDPSDWVIVPWAFVAAADTDVRLTAVGGTAQFDSGNMTIFVTVARVPLILRRPGIT